MDIGELRALLGAADRPILFVATSTEQCVANLPPILELADAARDHVIMLETPRAAEQGWTRARATCCSRVG